MSITREEFERLRDKYTNYKSLEWKQKQGVLSHTNILSKHDQELIAAYNSVQQPSINYVQTGAGSNVGSVTTTGHTGGNSGSSGGNSTWIYNNPSPSSGGPISVGGNLGGAMGSSGWAGVGNNKLSEVAGFFQAKGIKESYMEALLYVSNTKYKTETKEFDFVLLPEIEAYYYYKLLEFNNSMLNVNKQTGISGLSYSWDYKNMNYGTSDAALLHKFDIAMACMALNVIMTRIVDKKSEIKRVLNGHTRTEGILLLIINYLSDVVRMVANTTAISHAVPSDAINVSLHIDQYGYIAPTLIEPVVMLYGDINAPKEDEETVRIESVASKSSSL